MNPFVAAIPLLGGLVIQGDGDSAVNPAQRASSVALERFVSLSKAQGSTSAKDREYELQNLYAAMLDLAQESDTRAMLKGLSELKPEGYGYGLLLNLLALKGDAALATPLFLRILREGDPRTGDGRPFATAFTGIARSSRPEAIAYLLERLNDPRTHWGFRKAAYASLPRFGGPDARRAVLRHRSRNRRMPPLAQAMGLASLSDEIVPWHKSRWGETSLQAVHGDHGIVTSGIFGSLTDLFLVRKVRGRWTDPVYTGVSLDPRRSSYDDYPEAAREAAYRLVQGEWVGRFIGNPALRADGDRDGLSDLAEVRLGTDPKNPDSDGDGLSDSADRNPLAAPRPLTDGEAVIWAAFEAEHRTDKNLPTPFLFDFPGKPFELLGPPGYVIGRVKVGHGSEMFGMGPYFVSADGVRVRGEFATVEIGTSYAPLGGYGRSIRLRKIDGVWFVIESSATWIS